MNGITSIILVTIMALLGGIPTLFLTLGIPATIIYKIYRKVHYNIAITD